MLAKALSDEALDPVTLDCAAGVAAGDRHAEPGTIVRTGQDDQQEEGIGKLAATVEDSLIGRLGQQTGGARESAGGDQRQPARSGSDGRGPWRGARR